MNSENEIRLSGPFSIFDSSGRAWEIQSIRIVDESYGMIDVYVDLSESMQDEPLYEDEVVIRQLLMRLRFLGYTGPDFGPGDIGLQDDKLIVLEAGEQFNSFAASKGWKNLAEAYLDENHNDITSEVAIDADSQQVFSALMKKLRQK